MQREVLEPESIGVILPRVPVLARQSRRDAAAYARSVLRTARRQRRDRLFARIGVPALYAGARLRHLSPALRKAFIALPEDMGLMLWGKPGRGKSYAMAAAMRHYAIVGGFSVKRVNYDMLCLDIRDTYKPGSRMTERGVISPLISADKLVIEDVGTTVSGGRHESDFSLRTFLVLLDRRLEHKRATFITTNKSVEDLAVSFDSRIASRLRQACKVIHLTGADRRAQKKT